VSYTVQQKYFCVTLKKWSGLQFGHFLQTYPVTLLLFLLFIRATYFVRFPTQKMKRKIMLAYLKKENDSHEIFGSKLDSSQLSNSNLEFFSTNCI
jgi:hypothetical protein